MRVLIVLLALLSLPALAVGTNRATTSAPTYANGTDAPLSLTTDGKLRVDATVSTPAANSSAWPVKTDVGATAATTTTVLAGADAVVSASVPTGIVRLCSNNGSATAYVALGHAASSAGDHPVTVGAWYVEDRYTGVIHAYGTGAFACTAVTP